jgi:hypothetical protein
MKIIDKTPLQDEKGNISFAARVQGTLKYGLSWYAELEAQKTVIEQLDRLLEKGFILIRNFTLPGSDIVIPIILLGTGGMWVIYVTKEKGHFEAKGDQWNTVDSNGKSLPASINYIDRASKLATVFQRYLKIQKFELSNPVEPVLIAADPGAQIESVRPILRVVRSDAIKQFASSLLQAPPIWRTDFVRDAAERIVNPRPPRELEPVYPEPVPQQAAPANTMSQDEDYGNAFNAGELGFAFEESPQPEAAPEQRPSAGPMPGQRPPQQRPPARRAPANKKFLGLGTFQIIVLAFMSLIACCIILGLGYYIFLNTNSL